MFSTYDGAKKRAKELHRLFADTGIIFPLNQAQRAMARAGGFADWHALQSALSTGPRPTQPDLFRERLIAALPFSCRPPVRAWLDDELTDVERIAGVPRRYFRDAYPYLWASSVLHRILTPLLRPGSRPGQRLRETLVVGLLLNIRGGERPWPLLDPETLAMVFEGDLRSLFRDDVDHPRFATEFDRLQAEGIFLWRDGVLHVMPPDVDALMAHIQAHHLSMADYWSNDACDADEAADALRNALAALGVDRAARIAKAIVDQGSAAYTTPSGAILTLMTELAEQGDIITLARAYNLFSKVHRVNSSHVRDAVPGKIMASYFGRRLQAETGAAQRWSAQTPSWSIELKAALSEPALFAATVDRMADQIAAA